MNQCAIGPYIVQLAARVERQGADIEGLGKHARDHRNRIGTLEASLSTALAAQVTLTDRHVADMCDLKTVIARLDASWEQRHREEHEMLDRILAAVTVNSFEHVKRWEWSNTALMKGLGALTLFGGGLTGAVWLVKQFLGITLP